MAKARVSLKQEGPRSLTVGGRRFAQGEAHVVTVAQEIADFKAQQSIFNVEEINEAPPAPAVEEEDDEKPSKKSKSKDGKKSKSKDGKKAKKAPEIEPEEDDDDSDEESDDDEDDEGSLALLTEDEMRAMTKSEILAAAKERGIPGLDDTMTKPDMIAAIVVAQKD